MYIYSGNERSQGAARLARELRCRRIKHVGSHFRGARRFNVINWGSHILPESVNSCTVANNPYWVNRAADKLAFFRRMQGTGMTPEYTTLRSTAEAWFNDTRNLQVVCRTLVNASGGRGIVLAGTLDAMVDAPLYTKYKRKEHEYRVHLFRGMVFDTQMKKIRQDFLGTVNHQIRNHSNGYIYARDGFTVPDEVHVIAQDCLRRACLDFGAVDIIWNTRERKPYVLEINTAPGLEGGTIMQYAHTFRDWELGRLSDLPVPTNDAAGIEGDDGTER